MKKIKVFVVTYKRNKVLAETLDCLFDTDFTEVCDGEVYVISNHTSTVIEDRHKDKITLIKNEGRPDWSNGNLSESWNQAIVHGFKDLSKPECDFVVTLQNDALVHKNWCSNLIKYHEKFDFIQGQFGDNVMSFAPAHIKKVGLFDERFCSIQFKEADYCLRSVQRNKERSYINDLMARIEVNNNPSFEFDIKGHRNIGENEVGSPRRKADDGEHSQIWSLSRGGIFRQYAWRWFAHKWKGTHKTSPSVHGWCIDWHSDFVDTPPQGQIKEVVRYPYFEKDIDKSVYEVPC
tara:strand:+ start:2150 stop:3022 length:873 start_codon:yes stop_codon:yes gene_type:complete